MIDKSASEKPTKPIPNTAGERAAKHIIFLNQMCQYFERLAVSSKEDIDHQAYSSNARNTLAAANYIAVLSSELARSPAVKPEDGDGCIVADES